MRKVAGHSGGICLLRDMNEEKCVNCEEVIDENGFDSLKNEVFCENCYYNGMESATKMVMFSPEGSEEYTFDEDFNYTDLGADIPEPIKKIEWKNTDGWRGYTTWKLEKGFIELVEGWITEIPDETTKRKAELSEYFNDLKSGKLIPPVAIYWIFGTTSNVFSQSSAIIIRKEDKKELEKWLLSINGGLKEFQNKFS